MDRGLGGGGGGRTGEEIVLDRGCFVGLGGGLGLSSERER